MLLGNYIKVFDNMLPPAFCNQVMNRYEETKNKVRDWRLDLPLEAGYDLTTVSTCLDVNLNRYHDLWGDLESQLLEYFRIGIHAYMNKCPGCHFPIRYAYEAIRVRKYQPGAEQHFKPHTDTSTLSSSKRFLGAFFYLKDVEEGGETIFPHINISVKPKRGRMLLFPPYWMYVHAGLVPISGPKWLVSTYLHHIEGVNELLAIQEVA